MTINSDNNSAGQAACVVDSTDNIVISDNANNKTAIDSCPLGAAESSIELHAEIIKLQNTDDSLEPCFKMAKAGKSEFFVHDIDKLLYRKK